jgi:hypothetical protein
MGKQGPYKGKYMPRKPEKYRGDPSLCFYRSLWERRMMVFCDENDSVIEWSSEEVIIPYISPLDGRRHRYFVDFWVRLRKPDGSVEECLIEVKPKKQTVKPEMPTTKKVSKSKVYEIRNWMINSAKWSAAEDYCENRGWRFRILTEDNIFGAKK